MEEIQQRKHPRYLATSFWFTWDYLNWPDKDVADRIRQRADQVAESGSNMVVVFGTHFRWDYLPILDRVHDLLAFTANELHSRGVQIFDHHSSVLTHRAHNSHEKADIWKRNRHHLPFYPDVEFAKTLQFDGQYLNDWRVVDVSTNEPAWLASYTCEQFCMNNPGFQKGYQAYLRKLLREVPLDGLMSDDGIYYAGWRGCGCQWCRQRFLEQYGHELPSIQDNTFWGNRDSEAFKDWIEFRFRTVGNWLAVVKEAVGATPLMSCCSNSHAQHCIDVGMSYEDYAPHCDLAMLEMCGTMVEADGTWNHRIASQLLQLAIARDADFPCLGLGYGFFPDSAAFIWAIDKFLGSDVWISSLKSRLGQPDSAVADLADEPELVSECFNWERNHPDLFTGAPDAQVAVFYSRNTRDFYGQVPGDYVADYDATCKALMEGQITFEVTSSVPNDLRWPVLVVSSAICLSDEEREKLEQYINKGGAVVATGPVGVRDARGRLLSREKAWLGQYGVDVAIEEPVTAVEGGYPPHGNRVDEVPECTGAYNGKPVKPGQWFEFSHGQGKLIWSVGRALPHASQLDLGGKTKPMLREMVAIVAGPEDWYFRRYRDGERLLIQAVPAKVRPVLHSDFAYQGGEQRIIESIAFDTPSTLELCVETKFAVSHARLHSPDLPGSRDGEVSGISEGEVVVRFSLQDVRRLATIEIVPVST